MIATLFLRNLRQLYKRNVGCIFIPTFNPFYSTNKYNNKMEEVNQLAAKIEEVKIEGNA
jgi:hypothetical protein